MCSGWQIARSDEYKTWTIIIFSIVFWSSCNMVYCYPCVCRELTSGARLKRKKRRSFKSCNKSGWTVCLFIYLFKGIKKFRWTASNCFGFSVTIFFFKKNIGFREEELQLQKLKKRKVKVDPRLSFCDDIDNSNEEEDVDNSKLSNTFLRFTHIWLFQHSFFIWY